MRLRVLARAARGEVSEAEADNRRARRKVRGVREAV